LTSADYADYADLQENAWEIAEIRVEVRVQPSAMEGIQTLPFPYGFGGFARPDERTVDFRVRYTFGGLFFSPEGAQVLSHGRQPVEYRPHLRKRI
ncbi:MAG: hypothetical protein KAV82_10735, partial [Phycisphaerae bacterium]|nr:hypothetical protein [Phycisphaerae bacterium]